MDSTFFFLTTEVFRDQSLFLMKETANGYNDILNMPTDLRIKLVFDILEMKKLEKEKMEQMQQNLSLKHKTKR